MTESQIHLSIPEAKLFNALVSFFGRDRIVVNASLALILAEVLPEDLRSDLGSVRCLFSILDDSDRVKLTFDIDYSNDDIIDLVLLEQHQLRQKVFSESKITYIMLNRKEIFLIEDEASILEILRDRVQI